MQTCLMSQPDKVNHQLPAGLLEPLPLASRPWESVTMDFIMTCPTLMVQRHHGNVTFIVAPADYKADEAARLFIKHIVKLWGVPKSIVSDRDP